MFRQDDDFSSPILNTENVLIFIISPYKYEIIVHAEMKTSNDLMNEIMFFYLVFIR